MMSSLNIVTYNPERKQEWDYFVRKSKNGSFLFFRDYMDYHSDRFTDRSLMFYMDGELLGLLPANITENADGKMVMYSHQGLTYGGLVMGNHSTLSKVCGMFESLRDFLKENNISELAYKAVPHIYHKTPSEEDLYALHNVLNAQLMKREAACSIDFTNRIPFRSCRFSTLKVAKRNGVEIVESDDYAAFWQILSATLHNKYNTTPVHSVGEIELLHSRFPDNIRLFTTMKDGEVLSGVVLYVTDTCVHTQYVASSEKGNKYHCNELIIDYLLDVFKTKKYFDYGTSSENGGKSFNESLVFSKESYGCRTIAYDTYKLTIP
ncbi:MAG: GNAT family N-acetyltransferase [Bacteroidaceae bacterium]|nr:GNAT family N-acetyltransferase [Bacteroidaceae bacterium]